MDEGKSDGDGDGALRPLSWDTHVDQNVAVLDRLDDIPVAEHADGCLEVLPRLGGELNPEQKPRHAGPVAQRLTAGPGLR